MIAAYISLMRPKHWLKNVFVLAPVAFAGQITDPVHLRAVMLAFGAFCLAASAIYCFNDVCDLQADKNHPRKSKRPVASGAVSVAAALSFAVILAAAGLAISSWVDSRFLTTVLCYLAINVYYTIRGKHMVIGDAFCIAIGFVLRVIGGAYAINVDPTGWIVITTFFLSLFLGFGKRRNEIVVLESESMDHRPVLGEYNLPLLDQIMVATGTISIISYAIYTLDHNVIVKFGTDKLFYTVPFVAYGVFRYTHLLLKSKDGDPTEIVTSDRGLILTSLAWLASFFGLWYYGHR